MKREVGREVDINKKSFEDGGIHIGAQRGRAPSNGFSTGFQADKSSP